MPICARAPGAVLALSFGVSVAAALPVSMPLAPWTATSDPTYVRSSNWTRLPEVREILRYIPVKNESEPPIKESETEEDCDVRAFAEECVRKMCDPWRGRNPTKDGHRRSTECERQCKRAAELHCQMN